MDHSGREDVPGGKRKPRRWSRWLTAALTLAAVGFILWSLAPQTLGETARRKFLSQLQSHYRGYAISIRRGTFDPEVGLIFEDLRIWDTDSSAANRGPRQMVRIERMTVMADVHPERLLDQQTPIETQKIVLDGVQANAWLDPDGSISLARLMPLPKLGPEVPLMKMRRIHLRLLGNHAGGRSIDVELGQCEINNQVTIDGTTTKKITFSGSTDFADQLTVALNMQPGVTDVRGYVNGAFLSRDLFDRLPAAWAEKVREARQSQCQCDVQFAYFQREGDQPRFRLRANVHDGRLIHPSLPRPLAQVCGIVIAEEQGIRIESSQATFGDAIVRLSGTVDDYQWPCEARFHVSAKSLLLDDRLAAALPPSMQAQWERLQPLGRIDVDAHLDHSGGDWKPEATIRCHGVDVRYEKFPYPVEQLIGTIEVREGIASTESLSGRVGGNRMQCALRVPIRPGLTKEKSFVVATDGPVAIDNTLLHALTPRGEPTTPLEEFVRSLRPRGSVQLAFAVFKTDAKGRPVREIDLRVIDGHLRYSKFNYPLYNVAGRVEVADDLVTLNGFRATNANAGTITCDGTYRMPSKPAKESPDAGEAESADSKLALTFHASNVPMDDSLRRSLPEASQQTWDAISPSGVLDDLTLVINQDGKGAPLQWDVKAQQYDRSQVTNRSLSLRPISLPYRIDVTGGTVRFDGSHVTIDSIHGRHDASTLSADGKCVRNERGRWELLLNIHSGSRLHPDGELIAALPDEMREALRRLQLRGPVSVRGQTRLAMPDATHPEPAIQWDLGLQLEGNRIADVGPVHSLRGEVSIKGVRDEKGIRAVGDIWMDSMHVNDLQITSIRGPFSIEEDRLQLGTRSRQARIRLASLEQPVGGSEYRGGLQPIRGRLFGGRLEMDGEVILSSGSFNVVLDMQQAQVPIALADYGHGDNELTGTFSGHTHLQGNLGRADLLKGSGEAQLSGANLYKLPLLVQVLNLLRVTPGEDVAFTDGEVDFTIFGDTVTFNELQIWGDLVALHGGGTLDRRRELDLTFNTRVSPQNTFTQVVRPLRSRRYTLWTIDVRGPMHSPDIQRRALDGVGETLERLFPTMASEQTLAEPISGNPSGGSE